MIKKEFEDKILIDHLKSIEKDGMSVFIMADGRFRGAFFNGTELVNQMRVQHNLGILETLILGHGILCAALMVQTMKGKEHIVLNYSTNGAAQGFSVEVDSTGYVRGFIFNNVELSKPLESWDLSQFFGDGTLTVTRYTEGAREPHIGTTEIVYKNIAQDLTHYFLQSEQINTAFNTSVQFDKEGRVIGAGGMFLQSIPNYGGKKMSAAKEAKSLKENDGEKAENTDKIEEFASMAQDELIMRAENAFRAMPSIGQWFADKGNREDVVYGLFREFNPKVVLERDIIFDCPCSKESFARQIKNLPSSEVESILNGDVDPLEVICHNCGSVYHISKDDLR